MRFLVLDQKRPAGYTMVEILLVLAAITILAGMSLPIYQSFQVKNYLDVGVNDAALALRRAQLLSQGVEGDSNWGVKVETGQIVMFKGISFSSRDPSYDETFELPQSITPSGDTEFVFNKVSGEPQSTGSLNLTSANGDEKILTINAKGMVNY